MGGRKPSKYLFAWQEGGTILVNNIGKFVFGATPTPNPSALYYFCQGKNKTTKGEGNIRDKFIISLKCIDPVSHLFDL